VADVTATLAGRPVVIEIDFSTFASLLSCFPASAQHPAAITPSHQRWPADSGRLHLTPTRPPRLVVRLNYDRRIVVGDRWMDEGRLPCSKNSCCSSRRTAIRRLRRRWRRQRGRLHQRLKPMMTSSTDQRCRDRIIIASALNYRTSNVPIST